MKKYILLFILFAVGCQVNGQDLRKSQFKVNFYEPGVEWEWRLTKNISLDVNPYIWFYNWYDVDTPHHSTNLAITVEPIITTEGRWYYNMNRRAAKGENTSNNSGSFFALQAVGVGPTIWSNYDDIPMHNFHAGIGAVWGFQRTYKNKLNISFRIGVKYGSNDGNPCFSPIVRFTFGRVYCSK